MADPRVAVAGGGMHPQADSPLAIIPLELLVRMTYFITTKDLGELRLSCKVIERALWNFFSHEFFSKKQFMASPLSLQALVDISNHASLAPCLKHVIICTDRYPDSVFAQPDRQQVLNRTRDEYESLLSTGLLMSSLAKAFANLPNLETVDMRDFNSPTRSRDQAWWTSYGVSNLTRQIGSPPAVDGGADSESYRFRSMLFQAIVAALGVANARPSSLEVNMRSHALHDKAYLVPSIPSGLETPISQMLAGLKRLHVFLLPPHHLTWDLTNIKKFLLLAPNLTWLRINLSSRYTSPGQYADAVEMLCWVAGLKSDGKTPLSPTTEVPTFQLDMLELGSFQLRPAALQGIARSYSKTLQSLSFRRVTLISLPQEDEDKINLWAGLIGSFQKLGNLRRLSLAQLKQGNNRISLPHPDDAQAGKRCNERTFKETSGLKIAEIAAGMVTPDWPAPPAEMDVDDDEEDYDEDDDDEDDDDEDDDDA
ncbi:hypothetical protein QBC37DRAFT_424734 [Rhypophila decipiens]|uniref:F-box domain-containing protein n=1 Tax=Rhypophila decipiens TaxID=261697 RepID=A0AAN6Y5E4_9PEZI|nr:hypothetical protein QBC37DRAFT_424734 [Rhypophila decipiens]